MVQSQGQSLARNNGQKIITNSTPIKIKWVSSIKEDFSFRHKWSYPEGIYKNAYGQLSCDGLCPDGIENMKDSKGKIIKDSIKAFYKIVDTSHLRHSILSTAWCYEWAGTDFIEATTKTGDTVFLSTVLNAATHCSLRLSITGDHCYPLIDLVSIIGRGGAVYYCTGGSITIDKVLWQKGIVKAIFSFNFKHEEDPAKPMFWRGRIYQYINSTGYDNH